MANSTQGGLNETLFAATRDINELSGSDKFGVAVYCLIGICGLVGNGLACIVFRTLQSRRNQVSLLIFTQALVDLVTSMLLITFGVTRVYRHRMPTGGPTGEWLCRFWWSRFVLFYFFAISTFNLTLISLERYTAVVHPLTYSRRFTRRNTKLYVALIWLFCPIMQYGQPLWGYTAASGTCETLDSWEQFGKALSGVLLYLWELVTPICVMGTCYVSIVKTLRAKEHACKKTPSIKIKPEPSSASVVVKPVKTVRRDVTITLFILFVLFVICWTPNQTTFLQFNLGGPLDFNGGWYHFTVILGFLNCCVNPFVYSFRLKQFRLRVLLILSCRCSSLSKRTNESDNELFRDPDSASRWSSRKEKLSRMFRLSKKANKQSVDSTIEDRSTITMQSSPGITKKARKPGPDGMTAVVI